MAMVAAKNKYNRVVQVGQWQRSNKHWKDAADYVQSGKLGKIRMTKAWVYIDWKSSVPVFPDEPVPAGVDYDMWLGPAPQHAFNRNRFHFNFRWFWEYAGGLMTDWGVHLIDMVMMGMNVKTPSSVMSLGGKYAFPDDAMVTPDTLTTVYDFKDFSLTWEHTIGIGTAPYGRAHGVAFVGSLGTLVADRQQWMVLPETDGKHYKTEYLPIQKASDAGLDLHAVNFIDCMKDRSKTPNCSIEIAANTAMVSHMGNAAYRTKEKLDWDEKSKLFVNNSQANALITPTYRSPWKFPKIV
jgi:predicted dehydrogenase